MSKVDGSYVWYEDADFQTKITAPFTLNADKTIYAGATIEGGGGNGSESGPAFYLSYNSNGGSYIRARKFTEPTEVDFEDPNYIPTYTGYKFTGWYTDFDLATRMDGKAIISDNTTVVAGWTKLVKLTMVYDQTGNTPDVVKEFDKGTNVNMSEVDGNYDWY
jgi:hypothetical protein